MIHPLRLKGLFASFFIILTSLSSSAQKELTLKDAVLKRFTEFYPDKPAQLQWINGADKYSYIEGEGDSASLAVVSADGLEKQSVVSLGALISDLELEENDKPKSFPKINWLNEKEFYFSLGNDFYVFDGKQAKKRFALPENAEHEHFNKKFTLCSYIKEHNLFLMDIEGNETQVTTDGKPGIVYGQAVHRNEFGIQEGIFWSEDGKAFAFYRMDETMVEDYPLVHINSLPAEEGPIKYPMAGRTSHHVTIGIHAPGGKTLYLQTGGPLDHYLTNIAWDPNGIYVYVAELNRGQDHMRFNQYDASTGAFIKTLFEEKHPKYVEPEHPAWFFEDKPEEFLWFSERDGYQHLYRYNTKGELLGQVTKGKWEAQEILGPDQSGQFLFVEGMGPQASEENPYNPTQHYIYKVGLETGKITMVDSTVGWHEGWLSPSGSYLLQEESNITLPREISLYAANGRKIKTIHTAADPLEGYAISVPEIISLKADDGTDLYARVIKPSDFHPSRKYPALIYVYNGPHVQLVQDRYLAAAPLWMYYLAEQDYIVFSIDGRGSANRGIEFENVIFRQAGKIETQDQMLGYNYLTDLPYVNGSRIGVHGWSYGGFMTLNLLLGHPGKFKAGVAGGPVTDWKYYEVMYTERYMDTPETNAEGFSETSLIAKAPNLKDDLLIIHGTIDDVVVWQHSLDFLKSAIDHGVQLDYFVYPGHRHNVLGKDRAHLMEKVLDYITDRL